MENGEPTDQELFSEQFAPDTEEVVEPVPVETTNAASEEAPEAEAAPAEEAPVVEAEAEPAEQAPVSEATQPEHAQPEGGEHPKGWVPPHRVREHKEAKQKAEAQLEEANRATQQLQRELAELRSHVLKGQPQPEQKPEETPDFFADPEGSMQSLRESLREEIRAETARNRALTSFALAKQTYGDEYQEAYEAVNSGNDSELAAAIWNAPDPGEALVQHHRRNKLLQETGGDLTSYVEKLKTQLVSDPTFQAQVLEAARANAPGTTASGTPNLNLPASVNGGTRAADARPSPVQAMSDEEEFANVMRR